jgi:hypothetical protein
MSNAPQVAAMLEALEADAEVYFDGGRNNNITDITLTVSAIVTSLIAAVVAATDVVRWVRVGVAAIPAACTSIQKVIDVRARSNWYFSYAARLRALAVTLQFATSPDLADFAKKRATIDLEMENAWGKLGRNGAKLTVGGHHKG